MMERPSHIHYEMIIIVLKKSFNVLIEKPVARGE